MITKIEKQNVLSFRYGSNADTDYILTLDGKEIGRVQELEHARMIEETSSLYQLEKLEIQLDELKKENENLTERLRDAENKLKKIHRLSSTE